MLNFLLLFQQRTSNITQHFNWGPSTSGCNIHFWTHDIHTNRKIKHAMRETNYMDF